MHIVSDILTDGQVETAFGYADFGNISKRDVVRHSLLKYACGYQTGKTARAILIELELLTEKNVLTKKGKQYLYAAFCNDISL